MADPADPPDGRRGVRLPPSGVPVPWNRRAMFPGGLSPPGPLRRRHHPARRPQLRRGAPGSGAQAAVPLRPAAGHRRVSLLPPPRHGPGPHPQRLGAAADDPVLHGPEHQRLLRRRGIPGKRWRTGTAIPGAMQRGSSAACPTRWSSSAVAAARTAGRSPSRRSASGPRCPARSGWFRPRPPSA